MESRSYNFGTAKKRSTLLDAKGIEFPLEDFGAPRMQIARRQCPPQYENFMSCLKQNQENPDACKSLKEDLFTCGRPGFKKANTDPNYTY